MKIILALVFVFAAAPAGAQSKYATIEAYCGSIVGDSYRLMETCIRGEREAEHRIKSRRIDTKIYAYCYRIVPDSFRLFETCVNGEEESKRRLGYR